MVMDFYGSEDSKQKADFNTPFQPESVFGLSFDKYKIVSENITMFGVRKRMESLGKKLDLLHQKLGGEGRLMYPNFKNETLVGIIGKLY